jgi:fatty-acyl-CoA synthase
MKSSEAANWPRHLPHVVDIPECNVCWHLIVSGTRHPTRVAVVDEQGALPYGTLLLAVKGFAGYLQSQLHIQPGDRVLLYLGNSREWIIVYYAILYCGAVVVPINPLYKRDELTLVLRDTEPVAAICSENRTTELAAAMEATQPCAILHAGQVQDALALGCTAQEMLHEPDRLALILYSSGSTGTPKGCMHTHRSLNASTVIVSHWMWMAPSSVHLVALPFFHITGMQNLLNAPVYAGATLVLLPRWNREHAAELIARHGISHWTAMPTMVIDFLGSPDIGNFNLSSVRRMGGGGAGMPEAVGERLKQMTGLDFLEGYGLSETAHVTGNPLHAFKRQCLGIPLFNTDVRIIDLGSARELPPGEVGEIVMAGPQLFTGYWRNDEASRAAVITIDGMRFVRSGDLGRRDEEGYFFITDRLKRMVNASGYKVWPAEIESLLHQHPAVAEACVISAPDAYRGETVKAVIVLRPQAQGSTTVEDIIAWSSERMAVYKYPRQVEFVDTLPKTATGKVAWRELQEREHARATRLLAEKNF